jgi:hypothetical protein
MRYLLIVIAVVAIFTIFTTVFAASASKNEVRLLPKWAWVLICLLVPGVGGILYLAVGRPIAGAGGVGAGGVGAGFGRGRNTRTVAPDDDPEFLRRLRERLNADDAPNPASSASDPDAANGSASATEEPDEDQGKAN